MITSNVPLIFKAIRISSLEKCFFMFYSHFFHFELFVFLLINFTCFMVICFQMKISSPKTMIRFFASSLLSFGEQNCSFSCSQMDHSFPLIICEFCVVQKNSFPTPSHKAIIVYFLLLFLKFSYFCPADILDILGLQLFLRPADSLISFLLVLILISFT